MFVKIKFQRVYMPRGWLLRSFLSVVFYGQIMVGNKIATMKRSPPMLREMTLKKDERKAYEITLQATETYAFPLFSSK